MRSRRFSVGFRIIDPNAPSSGKRDFAVCERLHRETAGFDFIPEDILYLLGFGVIDDGAGIG